MGLPKLLGFGLSCARSIIHFDRNSKRGVLALEETSQQAPDEPTSPLSSLQSLHPTTPSPGEGVHVTEGFHTSWDGRELFCRHWTGPRDSNATVVLMHGYAEHSGRYHHVATGLVEAGYDVRAIDARGHGRSPGVRAWRVPQALAYYQRLVAAQNQVPHQTRNGRMAGRPRIQYLSS